MYTTRPPDPDVWTDLDWIDITRTSAQSTVTERDRERERERHEDVYPRTCPFPSPSLLLSCAAGYVLLLRNAKAPSLFARRS